MQKVSIDLPLYPGTYSSLEELLTRTYHTKTNCIHCTKTESFILFYDLVRFTSNIVYLWPPCSCIFAPGMPSNWIPYTYPLAPVSAFQIDYIQHVYQALNLQSFWFWVVLVERSQQLPQMLIPKNAEEDRSALSCIVI